MNKLFLILVIVIIIIIFIILFKFKNKSKIIQENFSDTLSWSPVQNNTDYPGNDIKSFSNYSLEKCKDTCADTENCKGIIFGPDGGYCWLKSGMQNRTNRGNRDAYFVTKRSNEDKDGIIHDQGCQPWCQYPDGFNINGIHFCFSFDGNCPVEWDTSYWNDTAGRGINFFNTLNSPLTNNQGIPTWNSSVAGSNVNSSWVTRFNQLSQTAQNDAVHIVEMILTRLWVDPFMKLTNGKAYWKFLALEIVVATLEYIKVMVSVMGNLYSQIRNCLKSIFNVQQANTMWYTSFELLILIDAKGYDASQLVTGYTFSSSQPFIEVAYALYALGVWLCWLSWVYNKHIIAPPNNVINIIVWVDNAITNAYKWLDLLTIYNSNKDNSTFGKLKGWFDAFAGDEYLQNNFSPKDSEIPTPDIPMSVQQRAYDNFLYATLRNCYTKYNPQGVNSINAINLRIGEMEVAKSLLSSSVNQTRAPSQIIEAINLTREIFWDKTKNAWRPGDNKDNYSNCNPIYNHNNHGHKIDGGLTRGVSRGNIPTSFYSFEETTEQAELYNKQLLNVAENLFKSIYGDDANFEYQWWTTPQCPAVKDQENTNVHEWVRESNENQPAVCKENPISTYKDGQYLMGQMKPGKIVDGKDIWIENANRIKTNMDDISKITNSPNIGNYDFKGPTAAKWRGMWSLGAGQMQNVLQDRDYELSTEKWKEQNDKYSNQTSNFIREVIIPVYLNLGKIFVSGSSNSSGLDMQFTVSYETEGQTNKSTFNILWIPTQILPGIKNITINDSKPKKKGFVRIYKNAYQFQDYNSSSSFGFSGGPIKNLSNLQTDIFSMIYIPISWDLVELANDRRDIYIIASNNNQFKKDGFHNLFSHNNWFLGRHVYSQFNKCYYAKKGNSPEGAPYGSGKDQLTMKWALIANSQNDNHYRLFNTESKRYLCWGINYDVQKNFNIGNFLPDGAFDQNKDSRQKILYFLSQDRFHEECSKSSGTCTGLQEDSLWTFKSMGNNKYQIFHKTGNQLWYTANMFLEQSANQFGFNPMTEPLKELLGSIGCSDHTTNDSPLPNWCAQNSSHQGCYNTEFIIVPVEPTDLTPSFQTANLSEGRVNLGMYNRKLNRYSNGQYDNGIGTWFRTITKDQPYSYADIGLDGKFIGDTDANFKTRKANPFANIYEYNNNSNEPIFNTLEGGGGDVCSLSNFTHPEREMLPSELYQSSQGWSSAYVQTDFPGNDLGLIPNQTLDACKQACVNNDKCVGITYQPSTRNCFPKNAIGNKTHNTTVNSYTLNRNPGQKYTKIGAYKDEPNRAMRSYQGLVSNAGECSTKCSSYQYFALQDSNGKQSQCFCDNDLQHAQKYGTSDCNELGGVWCNYIYKQKAANTPEPLNVNEEQADDPVQDKSNNVKVHLVEYEDPKDKPFSAFGWPWPNSAPHNFNITVQAPLQRHQFYCRPNEFLAINVEAYLSKDFSFMNRRNFTTFSNPNITYLFDLQASMSIQSSGFNDWTTKRVALKIWSSNSSYVEGEHFGMSPFGNYIWWLGSIDPSPLKFIYQTLGEMSAHYISLYNFSGTDNFKNNKTTICQWFDIYRFRSLGWEAPSKDLLYGYSKTINQGETFKEIL
jgi:hypothetical protein